MTSKLQFYIVDVFAESRFTGNQLAVFRGTKDLTDEDMLRIAQEMNYSETTFILSDEPRNGGYDVRIFTTVSELPFAGHPTLGTAYVIQNEILPEPVETITLNLQVGPIPVTFHEDGVLWMRQNPPVFGLVFEEMALAEVLGLLPNDLNPNFPVQEVSTGMPFVIAPLESLDAMRRVVFNIGKFDAMIGGAGGPLRADMLLVFCPEAYEEANDLNVRVFTYHHGPPEDPATGSANGCLAAYLSKYQYFGSPEVDCRVEQGYEIGRPSLLRLKVRADDPQDDSTIEVRVGGRVMLVARGEFQR
jgi:trans-2,3-dihydro-3-hydroxyanthranilate isomerase